MSKRTKAESGEWAEESRREAGVYVSAEGMWVMWAVTERREVNGRVEWRERIVNGVPLFRRVCAKTPRIAHLLPWFDVAARAVGVLEAEALALEAKAARKRAKRARP